MKKIFALLNCLLILLSVGCGNDSAPEKTSAPEVQQTDVPENKTQAGETEEKQVSDANEVIKPWIGVPYGDGSRKMVPTEGSRVGFIVNCEEWVTLRAEPSTSAESLAQIPLGTEVMVWCHGTLVQNGFQPVQIKTDNGYLNGFVLAEYVEVTEGVVY